MKWVSLLILLAVPALAATPDPADLVRIDEAFRLATTLGPRVWPGFEANDAPVVLVHGETEFLLNSAEAAPGFERAAKTRFRDRPVFSRARVFPPNLLASFPAIGREAVVVGTPEATNHTPAAWTLVICHELFHVFQDAHGLPGKVAALQIGPMNDASWQLNYRFPYDDARVIDAMHLLGHEIFLALQTPATDAYAAGVVSDALRNLMDVLDLTAPGSKNAAYLRFVMTKEGVARYFEYRVAQLAATDYAPSDAFAGQEGRDAFVRSWGDNYASMLNVVKHLGRVSRSRSEFYTLGLGLGLLLDRVDPQWQRAYFDRQPWLDDLYFQAVAQKP